MSFSHLGLSDKVLAAVEAAGYTTPTPIQEQAIPHVLARRDVLGIAQTGTGKTAAFVLPMLTMLEKGRARARMPRTLILEPTRELAAQVAGSLHQVRRQAQAQRRADHRRRLVRRPGRQADARRRRADRHARPPARSFRARPAAADRRRAAGHRRSRPHARHGLHPRHRAHLQAGAVHAPDAVLHRDHAAGNPAHRRAVPAQSGARRSLAAGHHGRHHHPAAGQDRPRAARQARHAAPPDPRGRRSSRTPSSSATASAKSRCCTARWCATASTPSRCMATWISRRARRRSSSSASGEVDAPGRLRRRGARPRHSGGQPRLQFRRAAPSRRLRPPHRPHRPRRPQRHRDHHRGADGRQGGRGDREADRPDHPLDGRAGPAGSENSGAPHRDRATDASAPSAPRSAPRPNGAAAARATPRNRRAERERARANSRATRRSPAEIARRDAASAHACTGRAGRTRRGPRRHLPAFLLRPIPSRLDVRYAGRPCCGRSRSRR